MYTLELYKSKWSPYIQGTVPDLLIAVRVPRPTLPIRSASAWRIIRNSDNVVIAQSKQAPVASVTDGSSEPDPVASEPLPVAENVTADTVDPQPVSGVQGYIWKTPYIQYSARLHGNITIVFRDNGTIGYNGKTMPVALASYQHPVDLRNRAKRRQDAHFTRNQVSSTVKPEIEEYDANKIMQIAARIKTPFSGGKRRVA